MVCSQQSVVGHRRDLFEQCRAAFVGVERIAVRHQKSSVIARDVREVFGDVDSGMPQQLSDEVVGSKKVVMVPDHAPHSRPFPRSVGEVPEYLRDLLVPVPPTSQCPAVQQIATDVDELRLKSLQKVQQAVDLRVAAAKMQIASSIPS